MDYRPLGRTDLKVSSICLGTMTFGEQNTQVDGFEQMDYALEQGVNFFDTAELYSIPPKPETAGSTETIIGNWFAARKNRDQIILATKVVGRSGMNWFRDAKIGSQLNRAQMEEALNKSLKRLQTDYIDLYQLHWPDRATPIFGNCPTVWHNPNASATPNPAHRASSIQENSIEEILDVLDGFVKAGKVRHIGLSNESAWGVMKFLHHSETKGQTRIQSIQNVYNLLSRTYEVNLAETTLREDVGLLAYSPLAQGYLTGKYQNGAMPSGSRKALFQRLNRYETAGADDAIEKYLLLAQRYGLNPTQMALAFVTTRPFVTSNIIGATAMEQLKTNIDSMNVQITPELEAEINTIHQLHCNPCP